jgi:hypothetical protein
MLHISIRRTWGAALAAAAAVAVVIATVVVAISGASGPALCAKQDKAVAGGGYIVQNDEWNSPATECIQLSGNGSTGGSAAGGSGAAFTVANSAISNSSAGAPGGYPSEFAGCFYSACSRGSGLPRQVTALGPGTLTSDWDTTQPQGGVYDASYDVWFATSASTSGRPDGAEMMIWIGHQGGAHPSGSSQGTTTIGGRTYQVWYGTNQGSNVPTVSYELASQVSQVSGLDIGAFAQDAANRGWVQRNWYLTAVQAGFELWQGGQGLATNSFTVHARG